MYPVPPPHLAHLLETDEEARKRLVERDRKLQTDWTWNKIDPGRGPVERK